MNGNTDITSKAPADEPKSAADSKTVSNENGERTPDVEGKDTKVDEAISSAKERADDIMRDVPETSADTGAATKPSTNNTPEETPKPIALALGETTSAVPESDVAVTMEGHGVTDDTGKSTTKITEANATDDDAVMDDVSTPLPVAPVSSAPEPKLPTSESDLGPAGMSQLAIESEIETSPVVTSVEASMSDAPIKVAREREDDNLEEPAPKRAKTEPKEEEVNVAVAHPGDMDSMDTTSAEPAPIESIEAASGPTVTDLKWDDPEKDASVISGFQRREMRKAIGKAKKTKAGGHFKDSVTKMWPHLADAYLLKIEKPMDLGQIDRDLREPNGPYKTFGDVKESLSLILSNAQNFNGPAHDVTYAALSAIRTIWNDISALPADEPEKPKALAKAKSFREPRAQVSAVETSRRQSSGPPAAAAPKSDTKPAPPAAPAQPSVDGRRDSIFDPDRPKRAVRAPKSKDIDYSTKASRKKLKPELQFCDYVLSEVMHEDHAHLNQWFIEAVDHVALGIPEYYSIIKQPMYLKKVQQMLGNGEISSVKEFEKNMDLIFQNCYKFNGPPEQNPVSRIAKDLQNLYDSRMKQKGKWLAEHAKANAPASNPSDDEDEDEDDEEADGPNSGNGANLAILQDQIKGLQDKLRDETNKLNDLFLEQIPNTPMIDMQQNIVTMVQKTLLETKQKHAEAGLKSGKPKKGGKPPKAGKVSGPRKSAGGATSKKSGPKKASKKTLTAADKDQIANAINDLEGHHLDRAIDIIKNDTGQNVSDPRTHKHISSMPETDISRKTPRASWNWISTSSRLQRCSNSGICARRFFLASPRIRRLLLLATRRAGHRSRMLRLARSPRKTSR